MIMYWDVAWRCGLRVHWATNLSIISNPKMSAPTTTVVKAYVLSQLPSLLNSPPPLSLIN